jgi:hypothetical protein
VLLALVSMASGNDTASKDAAGFLMFFVVAAVVGAGLISLWLVSSFLAWITRITVEDVRHDYGGVHPDDDDDRDRLEDDDDNDDPVHSLPPPRRALPPRHRYR